MNKIRWLLMLGIVMGIVLAVTSVAMAGLCNPIHYFGGIGVQSCKDNYKYEASYWKGRMISKVVSGEKAALIGWHSWTDTTFCNGRAYSVADLGPSYGRQRTYWASTSWAHSIPGCWRVDTRVYGKHYWETNEGSHYEEAWSLWNQVK